MLKDNSKTSQQSSKSSIYQMKSMTDNGQTRTAMTEREKNMRNEDQDSTDGTNYYGQQKQTNTYSYNKMNSKYTSMMKGQAMGNHVKGQKMNTETKINRESGMNRQTMTGEAMMKNLMMGEAMSEVIDILGLNKDGVDNTADGTVRTDMIINLCGNGQFVEHPDDPSRYYECLRPKAVEKQCEEGAVWVQPYKMCVRMNEQATTASLGDNPCVLSYTRYVAFPGDPYRYIECDDWWRMHVWHCPQRATWQQHQQTCVSVAQTTVTASTDSGPDPSVTTMVATDDSDTTSFCRHLHSRYHPYKPDSTRFIQCDDFGNMYIRSCGPNKEWADEYKTCVGTRVKTSNVSTVDVEETRPQIQQDKGMMQYMLGNREMETAARSASDDHTVQIIQATEHTDVMRMICPPGYTFQEGVCSMTDAAMAAMMQSAGHPDCGPDFHWDLTMKACMLKMNTDTMLSGVVISTPTQETPVTTSDGATVTYTGPNPCLHHDGYYFAFIPDRHYFIQCDEQRQMYIMPCPFGLEWNQYQLTCVGMSTGAMNTDVSLGELQVLSVVEAESDTEVVVVEQEEADGEDMVDTVNPCSNTHRTYHPHPRDNNKFIMCVQQASFVMACAHGQIWDTVSLVCNYPWRLIVNLLENYRTVY